MARDDRRAGCCRPECVQQQRPCCPSGVCRRSIARRASVFRGCSAAVPAGCIDRRAGRWRRALFTGARTRDARGGRADRRAVWRPSRRRGVTLRLPPHTPSGNHPFARNLLSRPNIPSAAVRAITACTVYIYITLAAGLFRPPRGHPRC